MELLEDPNLLIEWYAGPGVPHRDGEMAVARARGDADFAGVGELDGVANKIEQHPREALLVAQANRERLVHGRRKRKRLVLGERLRGRAHRLHHALDRVLAHVQSELAGFDLGDVEDRIDKPQQVLAVGADAGEGIEGFRSLRFVEALLDELGIAQNGRERCPQLVAHVGDELVLVLARDLEIIDGLGKLAGPRLDFFEQPRVFNRDYGLVREGVDEFNLAFSESTYLNTPDEDHANCLTCVDQRDGECGAPTELKRNLPAIRVFIRFGQDVYDLDGSPVDDGTCIHALTHEGYGVLSDRATQGNLPMVGDEAQTIAKQLEDRRVIRIAEARRGLDQRIEHPLQIKGRPADDLQNVGSGCLLFQGFC